MIHCFIGTLQERDLYIVGINDMTLVVLNIIAAAFVECKLTNRKIIIEVRFGSENEVPFFVAVINAGNNIFHAIGKIFFRL